MSHVLVTGSAGFLAQHIIPNLQAHNHFVTGVDKRFESSESNYFIHANVCDIGYRDLQDVDTIVHLAWRTNIPDCIRHPLESTENNILMTVKLIEAAKEAGVKRFIFPSTASLYGTNKTPWKEDMSPEPIEPYSWQKLACEAYVRMNTSKIDTAIPRFFQVFGECQREDTAISAFLRSKREGRSVTLTKTTAQSTFKSGQRDFIYAGDVADAITLLVESVLPLRGNIFNVGSGGTHTMEEVAQALNAKIEWIPRREHEVERHEADISKLKALGWEPKVNVIDWLKKQYV